MSIYKEYELVDGIYRAKDINNLETDGRHAVVIYGWNKDGWLVQNSWGVIWGNKGKFIIPYDFELNEVWAISDDIVEPTQYIIPYKNKLVRKIIAGINWCINLYTSIVSYLFHREE